MYICLVRPPTLVLSLCFLPSPLFPSCLLSLQVIFGDKLKYTHKVVNLTSDVISAELQLYCDGAGRENIDPAVFMRRLAATRDAEGNAVQYNTLSHVTEKRAAWIFDTLVDNMIEDENKPDGRITSQNIQGQGRDESVHGGHLKHEHLKHESAADFNGPGHQDDQEEAPTQPSTKDDGLIMMMGVAAVVT